MATSDALASRPSSPGRVRGFPPLHRVLKAWDDPKTGDRFVSGTTSSTIRDLQGDEMTLAALQEMPSAALKNMTIFLNRGYRFPNSGRKALP